MSEEIIDLDAINLCITEDVFEKFQAKSMYEEHEVITLPTTCSEPNVIVVESGTDGASTNSQIQVNTNEPDINIDLENTANVQQTDSQIIYNISETDENIQEEVCIETTNEYTETVPMEVEDQTSIIKINTDNEQSHDVDNVQLSTTTEAQSSHNDHIVPPVQLKRSGRKKKVSQEYISIEDRMNLIHGYEKESSDDQLVECNQNTTNSSTPKQPKRRGRKKNNIQDSKIGTSTDYSEVNNEENTCSRSENEAVSSVHLVSQSNVESKLEEPLTLKRRSRKKKNMEILETSTVNKLDACEDKTTDTWIDTLSNNATSSLTKRGRNSKGNTKDLNNDSINIVDNHISNSTLPNLESNSVEEQPILENSNSENTALLEESMPLMKLRKTRGRRTLNIISDLEDMSLENMSVNSFPVKKTRGKRGRPRKSHDAQPDSSKTEEQSEKPSSTSVESEKNDTSMSTNVESHIDEDDADDICLSNLKKSLEVKDDNTAQENVETSTENTEKIISGTEITPSKRNSKMPIMSDFEYNIDNIVTVATEEDKDKPEDQNDDVGSLLVEDSSKRPIRRRIKQNLHYDEESDEDPFANVELSDDEPRTKKGNRYYSDDEEYIPGKKHGRQESSDSSYNSDGEIEEDVKRQRRKRGNKKENSSPKKKCKKSNIEENIGVTTIPPTENASLDDIEGCLQTSVIQASEVTVTVEPEKPGWGTTHEFESFIAKKIHGTDIKIKKVSSDEPAVSIDIPSRDAKDIKKIVEMCTQTSEIIKKTCSVQTSAVYDIPMKENVALTLTQSEKACEFLNGIVKTTAELGTLMTQKSEDFMKKKINTSNVTDTFKMDYCVRKSFLLFKLAKHNLMQMEEDLAKQYDQFLKNNKLDKYREEVKTLSSTAKAESDSDCEIIEETPSKPPPANKNEVPKFNPKTVFLNKELSIKIAKKPADDKRLNIKGKHSVWINDSVILKKVKPTQSFLAQDSRNKKPPDCNIFSKIVHDFFREYNRQKVVSVCAPFVNTKWFSANKNYVCNYFVVRSDSFPEGINCSESDEQLMSPDNESSSPNVNNNMTHLKCINSEKTSSPNTLSFLCTTFLQKHLHIKSSIVNTKEITEHDNWKTNGPDTLFQLCLNTLNYSIVEKVHNKENTLKNPISLRTLSYKRLLELTNDKIPALDEVPDLSDRIPDPHDEILNLLDGEPDLPDETPDLSDNFDDTSTLQTFQGELEMALSANKNNRKNGMKTLFSLCVELIQNKQCNQNITLHEMTVPMSLKSVAYKRIVKLLYGSRISDFIINLNTVEEHSTIPNVKTLRNMCIEIITHRVNAGLPKPPKVKKLINMCIEIITHRVNAGLPKPPKVKKLINMCIEKITHHVNKGLAEPENMTINSVNTMSEEAFLNIVDTAHIEYDFDDANDSDNNFESEFDYEDNFQGTQEDSNWVTQVQMGELTSGLVTTFSDNAVKNLPNEPTDVASCHMPAMVHIKSEPLEDFTDNLGLDPTIIKTESEQNFGELTMTIENVTTKVEDQCPTERPMTIHRQDSASYDEEAFETFVNINNPMLGASEEIYSQSALRVRRQFEPDFYDENDMSMSLLVPHSSKPLQAKNTLMESSSDEDNSKDTTTTKKKTDKRKKKPKKVETKPNNKGASNTKNKLTTSNEVAVLTKKMRDRIRQEEKKVESSDSDTDSRSLRSKSGKNDGQDLEAKKTVSEVDLDKEIQCNNVDSTEQICENINKDIIQRKDSPHEAFTGFSTGDQDAISNYQEYMKNVYKKILPSSPSPTINNEDTEQLPSTLADEPEYLECEPTIPMFDTDDKPKRPYKKKEKKFSKIISEVKVNNLEKEGHLKSNEDSILPDKQIEPYVERHGWKCYPIGSNDNKILHCQIVLDKLPESFVEMYFRYQDINGIRKEDEEVDKLINLQSLNRLNTKDTKVKSKVKSKTEHTNDDKKEQKSDTGSRPGSPGSDHYQELTASEDETEDNDVELPPPMPVQSSENNLAKNSLMDDNESDTETAHLADNTQNDEQTKDGPKRRPGPKSKCKVKEEPKHDGELMLTAEKMMNKELTLLHAPIVLDENKELPEIKHRTRSKQKITTKHDTDRTRTKAEDDSSSEEEKQWVNTKEKLLKRMVKKQDSTSVDDAKRAKIVSEFIERREGAESRTKKKSGRRRSIKMTRKFLERQRQLSVLSKELFGESSDGQTIGKRSAVSLTKGRRNIRKVIDKKLLARSTVIANMEEFERKRRLSIKQSRLREMLGCEEGVNVLVINDELCLEYDFLRGHPVVAVHPFFTKIMKAHQYEGVKFMWDACFESLSQLAAGHGGGGCILAHCMGLGKTLQVLALLHTVLTHPGVGMRRVLVCCPLSTVLNWVDEIHKWIGPVTNEIKPRKLKKRLQVFELSKLKKTYERAYQLEDWYNGGGIFIIGYELFRSLTTLDPLLDDVRPTIINKIRTALLDPGPDIIVCDEGHLLKNDCSVLAVAMSRVVTKRRIILTGTPMQNNLREYYCMVNFVKPNLLGTYSEYSNRFENPIMNGQHRDSSQEDIKLMKARTHILHKVLEGCLQRQEVSVLYPYLPKKHEYTVFISLTKCQWDLYKHYLSNYGKNKQSILKDFHVLQKIWSHPQVLHNFQMRLRDQNASKVKVEKLEDDLASEELAAATAPELKPADDEVWWLQYLEGGAMLDSLFSSNKFVVVFRILDECIKLKDKVLIFSTSLFTMDALEFFLRKIKKWSLGQEYYRLDGSVPAEVRQKWCREFNAENNEKTKLFLISTRAGSLGLNMTAANRVIILDTSWNPAHDIQSIFRVYRFGQKKDCYIYRLVALGTMEQKIYERSVTKQAVACRVVDEQQIDRHYNMAELTELYRFDEEGSGVASGMALGVHDVALLRVAKELRALYAVHEHDSLLRGTEPALPEHERQAAWFQFQHQQQHEHRQMQNEIEQKTTKRPYAHVAKVTNVTSDPGTSKGEENVQDSDFKPPEPKKRGKKQGTKSYIPVKCESETPDEYALDPVTEQSMIKRIADILIKHNFQDTGEHSMISLVTNVRRTVAAGQEKGFANCDELTASIANVLLQGQDITLPALTDIVCESAKKTTTLSPNETENDAENSILPTLPEPVVLETSKKIIPKKNRPGPKCKKGYAYEEIPSTSAEPQVSEYDVRAKRRAAIAAQKVIDESANNDGDINLDRSDTESASETEIIPDVPKEMQTEKPTNKVQNKEIKSYLPKKNKKSKPTKLPVQETTKLPVQETTKLPVQEKQLEDNSITLSDDDEPVTAEPTKEPIPLHPSLLQNANFIKIVAHTYLAGNPMLDEDAATLAARYSTYKALKELEGSGKPIASGPIYDIAVKVLGIDILKKLYKTNDTLAAQLPLANATPGKQTEHTIVIASSKSKDQRPGPKSKTKSSIEVGRSSNSTGPQNLLQARDTPPPLAPPAQTKPDVVPVGLFRTNVRMPVASPGPALDGDECILPDDDDVRLVPDVGAPPAPALAPLRPRGPARPVLLTRAAAPAPPAADVTICLDSDDEDAAPPVAVSKPTAVPGKLIRIGPMDVPKGASIKAVTTVDPSSIILTKGKSVLANAQGLPCGPDVRYIMIPSKAAALRAANAASILPDAGESILPTPTYAPIAPASASAPKPAAPIAPKPAAPTMPKLIAPNPAAPTMPRLIAPKPAAPTMSKLIAPKPAAPTVSKLIAPKPAAPTVPKLIAPNPAAPTMPRLIAPKPAAPTVSKLIAPKPAAPIVLRHVTPVTSKPAAPITPKPTPPIVSKPPALTVSKPTTLITTKSTSSAPLGSKKLLLRPNDIIRIGKNGQLEVLNGSTDDQLELMQAKPSPVKLSQPASDAAAATVGKGSIIRLGKNRKAEIVSAPAPAPAARARSPSSSSSSSRSPSPSPSPSPRPHDPLSILRDVVHIQAAPAPAPEAPPGKASSNNRKYIAIQETNKTPSVDNTKWSGVVMDMVDLTDSNNAGIKLKKIGAGPAKSTPTTSTVSTSKLTRVTDKTTTSTKTPPQKKSEPKKRAPAAVETSAPKRKKGGLMTLKDFDIDDIDDIIELD